MGHEREDAVPGFFDAPLREPDELCVVIVRLPEVALAERRAVYLKIVFSDARSRAPAGRVCSQASGSIQPKAPHPRRLG